VGRGPQRRGGDDGVRGGGEQGVMERKEERARTGLKEGRGVGG